MSVYRRGRVWWYKFNWNGEPIRESTKQSNKRTAEKMEATHKASLAKGEVGIRDRVPVPTLKDFAGRHFLPHVLGHFVEKPKTIEYYSTQVRHLTSYEPLAGTALDSVTPGIVAGFVSKQRDTGYQVSSINRALQVLRRMLRLAVEWGKTEKAAPRIHLLPGERRRERVLTPTEEMAYLEAARKVGTAILEAYERALKGIRATKRGQQPTKPADPYLLSDVATILLDCGLRPEECHRLCWEQVRDGALHIPYGKTASARRSIPLSLRAAAVLNVRRTDAVQGWVFPAPTKSGHIEKSTLKKRHIRACGLAGLERVPFYAFRHTCLTRWSTQMDPYTLAYFAGHSSFVTTKRYVHPNMETGREAMERAREVQGGHRIGHNDEPVLQEKTREAVVIH
ncbi:MAG: tyrosine-type recombinase/integrase [Candidatus Hydrogenedentes bacterium]|nr:tyrosine-type recombinase/integrase [Candidatus Hydrogenedentota bacterium]